MVEGGVRWGGSPEQVNDDLRAICSGIRLGYEGNGRRRRLVPVGGIWKRPPLIDVWDSEIGESMLHPDAVPVSGGWYLPGVGHPKPCGRAGDSVKGVHSMQSQDYHQQYLDKVPNGYCPNHSTGVQLPDDWKVTPLQYID
jgi:hypothetical protein